MTIQNHFNIVKKLRSYDTRIFMDLKKIQRVIKENPYGRYVSKSEMKI